MPTDHAIVMGDTGLACGQSAEVLPLHCKLLESWVALEERDGSCLFTFIPDSATNAPRVHQLSLQQLESEARESHETPP